jgi:hypothetical protein
MAVMVNCVPAGRVSAMRMRPLLRMRLCEAVSPVAAVGKLAPSMAEKRGSVPFVEAKSVVLAAGVMLMPCAAWWQVAQVRPLVPSDWKKDVLSSMTPAVV